MEPIGPMGLIARMLDDRPEARRGTAEASRHVGLSCLVSLASCRCRGEFIPKSLQKSGYPADKLVSAQDGFQVFSFGEPVRALSRSTAAGPDF